MTSKSNYLMFMYLTEFSVPQTLCHRLFLSYALLTTHIHQSSFNLNRNECVKHKQNTRNCRKLKQVISLNVEDFMPALLTLQKLQSAVEIFNIQINNLSFSQNGASKFLTFFGEKRLLFILNYRDFSQKFVTKRGFAIF